MASLAGNGNILAGDVQAVVDGLQPAILAPSRKLAIARLTSSDIVFTPHPVAFSQTASDTLGNFGTPEDGFDTLFSLPAFAVNDDIDSISDLDFDLVDMSFTPSNFDSSTWLPIAQDAQVVSDAGDSLLGAFNDTVNPPAPAPPPSGVGPNVGGGGTGGGGVGGGNPGATGGTGGGTSPAGEGGDIKCTLVVSSDGGSQYVCQGGSLPPAGLHGPLLE